MKTKIVDLAEKRYKNYNFSHLADTLEDDHGISISDETLRLWLRPLGYGSEKYRRKKKHFRRRKRKASEGEMLFLDGSPHPWFGPEYDPVCLLISSDDATGKPLWGKFQPQENRDGCFEVCCRVFEKYGLPMSFYLDRASQFTTTRHGGVHYNVDAKQDKTHFETAMETLNIQLIFANSPQARGRIERLNGSFQGRLVNELVANNIFDCKKATRYLNSVFIPKYCKRFSCKPENSASVWRQSPATAELKNILCAKWERTVKNDNTISFEGQTYQLYPSKDVFHLANAKVEVRRHFNGSMQVVHPKHGVIKTKCIKE